MYFFELEIACVAFDGPDKKPSMFMITAFQTGGDTEEAEENFKKHFGPQMNKAEWFWKVTTVAWCGVGNAIGLASLPHPPYSDDYHHFDSIFTEEFCKQHDIYWERNDPRYKPSPLPFIDKTKGACKSVEECGGNIGFCEHGGKCGYPFKKDEE
jgi:hypothetical protein